MHMIQSEKSFHLSSHVQHTPGPQGRRDERLGIPEGHHKQESNGFSVRSQVAVTRMSLYDEKDDRLPVCDAYSRSVGSKLQSQCTGPERTAL